MKKYEIGFIIKPTLDEVKTKELIAKLKDIYVVAGSNIIDEFDMGKRELAYEIEKNKTGYYYFHVVETEADSNKEFERICRISEDVLRFMVINVSHVEGSTLDMLRK